MMRGPGMMGGPPPEFVMKMQALAKKEASSIEAVLTPQQRSQLPGALKEIGALRSAGIPLETLGDLKLTSSQKSKISTISMKSQKEIEAKLKAANGDFMSVGPVIRQAGEKTHADVMGVLTAPQKGVIDKYEKEHPRRGFGGGGFGGPGGGPGRRGGPGGGRQATPRA
jgi:hypothetical protein